MLGGLFATLGDVLHSTVAYLLEEKGNSNTGNISVNLRYKKRCGHKEFFLLGSRRAGVQLICQMSKVILSRNKSVTALSSSVNQHFEIDPAMHILLCEETGLEVRRSLHLI